MKHRLYLSFYSPVHIGDGGELEPFEYVIKDDYLYIFSFERFVSALNSEERQKLIHLQRNLKPSALKDIRNFIRHRVSPEIFRDKIPLTLAAAQLDQNPITNKQNTLRISPFIKTMNKPYLPGSSLKGALRTAILNYWTDNNNNEINRYTSESDILKTTFLEEISWDVFKYLKVPDIPITEGFTWFTKISNFNLKDNHLNENNIQMKEVTFSRFFKYGGYKPVEYEFEFIIKINEEIMQNNMASSGRRDLTFGTLWKSLDFYDVILKREKEKWSRYDDNLNIFYECFYDFLSETGKKYDIKVIKLGSGLGFEALTIDKIKDVSKGYGVSINLVEGKCPLGWAVLRLGRG